MNLKTVCLAAGVALGSIAPQVAAAQEVEPGHFASRPRVEIARVEGSILLDGRLDEPVWQGASAATDFRQEEPDEGEPATQRTEVRFALDESALYVGARMFDTAGAPGVRTRLARRDQDAGGDQLRLVLDTFHDHAGRTILQINPSGVKYDAGQAAPYADPSWDPVWEAATRVDSLGWTAELRIPLSQLRFPGDSVQIWGLQIWRHVERLNETSMWSFWGKTESGGPARFGHLTGIRIGGRTRSVEFLPYTTMRASYVTPTQPGSPFQDASMYRMRFGADVKALLTSTLTLDATFNPDFGQVEVDPAIVNLSAFETFLPERRPFFIEGSGLFGFGGLSCYFCSNASGMSLFYSRRIGRRPQGHLTFPTRYSEVPENSGILGAAKITGRTRNGLQVGVLNAVTASEHARAITSEGTELTREVEPLTNYFVGRVRQTYREGDLMIGAMGTSVVRGFGYDSLAMILPARAEAIGFDLSARLKDQAYSVAANLALSQVTGDPDAILRLQRSSARYFQRPDRRGGSNGLFSDRLDPDAGTLRGFGGYARVAREAGDWLWETTVNFRSPGFEVNDLAFLTSADYIWMNANLLRRWTEPTRHYREVVLIGGAQQQYNFDGDLVNREFRVYAGGQAPNYWNYSGFVIARPETYVDRMTRGGPVVKRPRSMFAQMNLSTDGRRALRLSTNPWFGTDADGAHSYQLNLDAHVRPAANVSLSVGPSFTRNRTGSQYVVSFADPTATHFHGQRTVFADLVQHSLSMETRMAVTFTPSLTLELYAQPLISSGEYSAFKEFTRTRTTERRTFTAEQLTWVPDENGTGGTYHLSPGGEDTRTFTFGNPDFNFRSLRGNAILRWEYRPGSTLFLVWQQNRSGTQPFGDLAFQRDAPGIFRHPADNVLVLKVAHWFGR